MSYLREKVAYLKGLAEGVRIDQSTNEGRLIKAIIDVLDDFAITIQSLEESQEELSRQVDSIDEELADLEDVLYGDDDEYSEEIICPHCGEAFEIGEDGVELKNGTIECPCCHRGIEVDFCCIDEGAEEEGGGAEEKK